MESGIFKSTVDYTCFMRRSCRHINPVFPKKLNLNRRLFMQKKIRLGIVAIFLLFPLLAQAQVEELVIPASAFQPMRGGGQQTWNLIGGKLRMDPASTYGWMCAPVHLPDGAKITKIIARVYDNGAENFIVYMYRINIYANSEQQMARMDTSGASSSWVTLTQQPVSYWQVDTGGYGYTLYISWGSALGTDYQIEGVKILYTM
jgi:hypothetical protein